MHFFSAGKDNCLPAEQTDKKSLPVSRKTIIRAAFYSTALIVFLLLVSPHLLEQVVNLARVKDKISSYIEQKTGVDIDQDKIEFVLFPQPGVRFKEIELSLGTMVELEIGAAHIDINILKLFKGQFAVSKILIESPHIQFTPPEVAQVPAEPGQTVDFRFPKQEIEQLFALFPDSQDTLELKINNIKTDYFDAMDGSFFVSNANQTLIFTALISGLNLRADQFPENSFSQKIDAIKSDKINMTVKLDGEGSLAGNIRVASPRILANKILEKALAGDMLDFDFQFSREKVSVALKPVVFSFPHARVGGAFTQDKPGEKTAITFTGDDIDIAQAGKVCLTLLGSNEVVDNLFDILRGGTASDVTVGFTSKTPATLFDGENLFLTGSASNSLVKIPQTPLIAQQVQGDAVLEKGILHIKARKGQVSDTFIKEGWLDIDLLNHEDIPFKGEFNLHSDLSTLPKTLISLLPDTLLARELALVKAVVGKTDARLKLAMKSMQEDLLVEVWAENLSLKGHYGRIPLPITITGGSFVYTAEKVVLKEVSGSLAQSFFENMNAVVDLGQTPYFDIRSGPARIDPAQIWGWIKSYEPVTAMMSPVKNPGGNLVVDKIQLDGPIFEPDKWQFDILGSGSKIHMGVAQAEQAVKSISGSFHLTHEMADVQDVRGVIEDLSWLSYAVDTSHLKSIELPLKMFEAGFKTAKGKAQFQGRLSFPSGPDLSFDLTGQNIADLSPRLLIIQDEALSDAMVMLNKDPSHPFLRFEGNFNTQTLGKMFIKDSFLYNAVTALTGGGAIRIFTDIDSRIHMDMEKLDLDSFLAIETQRKKSKNQPLFDQKSLYLTTRHLTYKKMEFLNVDSQINFTKNKTQVLIRNADLCNLIATGMVEINTDKQVTTDISILPLENQDLAKVLSCLFHSNNVIDGAYSFSSNLSGQAPFDIIAHKQNGSLTFNADNGRIYKWTLLSRLLSVLNILQVADISKEGIGYRTIVIEAQISNSIVHLKKAVIDADNMALILSGWIDPLNDTMDLTCLVAPFKTIDTIIKYIPVVNTMLSGRLAAFPAKAAGSIADPVITALHPSDVGKGLMNMFEDIIKTPVRLFEKKE
jgi:AsmA-like C-terminal region